MAPRDGGPELEVTLIHDAQFSMMDFMREPRLPKVLGPPRGRFHSRILCRGYRSRGGRYRSRMGDVRCEYVLRDLAHHLDMERLDDHAGHWARRKSPEMIYAISALGYQPTFAPQKAATRNVR